VKDPVVRWILGRATSKSPYSGDRSKTCACCAHWPSSWSCCLSAPCRWGCSSWSAWEKRTSATCRPPKYFWPFRTSIRCSTRSFISEDFRKYVTTWKSDTKKCFCRVGQRHRQIASATKTKMLFSFRCTIPASVCTGTGSLVLHSNGEISFDDVQLGEISGKVAAQAKRGEAWLEERRQAAKRAQCERNAIEGTSVTWTHEAKTTSSPL